MTIVADVLVVVLLGLGSFLLVTGAVGILRFPDFYTRIHAASVTDTLAVGSIILAFMILAGWGIVAAKLAFILVFILFTSPTAAHALTKAARQGGLQPLLNDTSDDKKS